jgi:hypothetical protein
MPGYHKWPDFSLFLVQALHKYGQAELTPERRGAVAFSLHPLSMREEIERKLENGRTSATCLYDPQKRLLCHFFILPLATLQESSYCGDGGYDRQFGMFCEHVASGVGYAQLVPVVQMIMARDERTRQWDLQSLKYYALSTADAL